MCCKLPHFEQVKHKKMADARQKHVVVSKPIVYGSAATYLGRKAEETKTHRWSIYLRGVDNEDLSYMISKVVITLHMSFANPVRGTSCIAPSRLVALYNAKVVLCVYALVCSW